MYTQVPTDQLDGFQSSAIQHPYYPMVPQLQPYEQEAVEAPSYAKQPFEEQPAPPTSGPTADVDPILNLADEVDELQTVFNKSIRLGFARKVLGIVAAQLTLTAFVTVAVMANERAARIFFEQNVVLFIIAVVGYLVTLVTISCCRSVARRVPINYILLGIFTLCMSYIVAMIAAEARPENVVVASFITAAMVIGLFVYALTAKTDFTTCGAATFSMSLVLPISLLLAVLFVEFESTVALSTLIVLLACYYMILHMQLIVSGKSHELGIDEYVFAAMTLYIDIIRLFLEILRMSSK